MNATHRAAVFKMLKKERADCTLSAEFPDLVICTVKRGAIAGRFSMSISPTFTVDQIRRQYHFQRAYKLTAIRKSARYVAARRRFEAKRTPEAYRRFAQYSHAFQEGDAAILPLPVPLTP